jgi:hypothetical protein
VVIVASSRSIEVVIQDFTTIDNVSRRQRQIDERKSSGCSAFNEHVIVDDDPLGLQIQHAHLRVEAVDEPKLFALLPAINVIALTIAWLMGGVVVVETVFNFPGLGRLMINAITDRDLQLVQAIALIVAVIYVGVNLAADIVTLLLNPRLRTSIMRRS